MTDYIKREDAIRIVENNMSRFYIAARIGDYPAADVAPVRHGRWIYKDEPIFGNPYGRYYCDLCEYGLAYEENYCPNCGAKMDEEDTNE